MWKYLDRLLTAAGGAIVGACIGAQVLGPALALVFPGQYAPRYFPTQQTHYERHVINIGSTSFQADTAQNVCVFAAGTCSVRIGALPYNSFVIRAYQEITTSCNAATTCTLALGTASGSGNLVAAQTIAAAAGGATALTLVSTNVGIVVTGNNATATGADGGFDLYATVAQSGTAATAGTVVIVIEYFGPNDGGCLPNIPLASTAGPC